MKKARRVLQLI